MENTERTYAVTVRRTVTQTVTVMVVAGSEVMARKAAKDGAEERHAVTKAGDWRVIDVAKEGGR